MTCNYNQMRVMQRKHKETPSCFVHVYASYLKYFKIVNSRRFINRTRQRRHGGGGEAVPQALHLGRVLPRHRKAPLWCRVMQASRWQSCVRKTRPHNLPLRLLPRHLYDTSPIRTCDVFRKMTEQLPWSILHRGQ